MTIAVDVKFGTNDLILKPSVVEMLKILSECFDKIISVAAKVPKIETILFPEFENEGFLSPVLREEDKVNFIFPFFLKKVFILKNKLLGVENN